MGPHAIAGVGKHHHKKRIQATEASGYTGGTSRGDGLQYDISATTGVSSSKGSLLFSAGYFKQSGRLLDKRDWSTFPLAYDWKSGKVTTPEAPSSPKATSRIAARIARPSMATKSCAGNILWNSLVAQYGPTSPRFPLIHDTSRAVWRPFSDAGTSDPNDGTGDLYTFAPQTTW